VRENPGTSLRKLSCDVHFSADKDRPLSLLGCVSARLALLERDLLIRWSFENAKKGKLP
jgi:hypothetical protein